MKLLVQQVLVITLITLTNAGYRDTTCSQFCSKHNPDIDPYELDCLHLYEDDMFECATYCAENFCGDRCEINFVDKRVDKFIMHCGKKVEIKKDMSLSTSEIVRIFIAVLVLLIGCSILGLGFVKMSRNQRINNSVGGGVAVDPGVTVTEQEQQQSTFSPAADNVES